MSNLSVKQNAFINEYLVDYNATKAAIRAGYSKNSKTAEVTGHRLLRNAKIRQKLNERMEDLAKNLREKFILDAIKALDVMMEVLNNHNSSDRDKIIVAKDLLDRAGFTAITKKEVSGPNRSEIKIMFVEPNNNFNSLSAD